MPTARINGCTIHYQQLGQGPDLVLIHGLLGNLAFWYFSVVPHLVQSFRVSIYDLRGHGRSEMPTEGYCSAKMAEDLRGLLEHLGVDRAHVAAHSFGGAIALHYAAHYPERVLSLTLADVWIPGLQRPLPKAGSTLWKMRRMKLKQAGVSLPDGLPVVAYYIFEEAVRLGSQSQSSHANDVSFSPGFSHSAVSRWSELIRTTSLAAEVCESGDLTPERIRHISTPVLALFGQYSHCLPTLRGLRSNLPCCEVAVLPGVGHLHPLLRPTTFVSRLRQFALGHAQTERA